MMKRMIKSYGSQSRKMAWANARKEKITIGTHVYIGSEASLDIFKSRLDDSEIKIRNLTFNNGGL